MKTKPNKQREWPQIGSVSSGTMICEDVFAACIDALREVSPKEADEIQNDWDSTAEECDLREEDGDPADEHDCDNCREHRDYLLNETLWNKLNEWAPPFCYFGAHPGDGCDYGFWLSEDGIEDAVNFDEMIKINAGDPIPKDWYGYVLEVNDHGNTTLKFRFRNNRVKEIWSIV